MVQEGVVKYEGGLGPHGYKVDEVEKWIEEYKNKNL